MLRPRGSFDHAAPRDSREQGSRPREALCGWMPFVSLSVTATHGSGVTLEVKHILHLHTTHFTPAGGCYRWHPRAPREHFRRVPKDVGTALTVLKRIIVITLNSTINVTEVEAWRVRLFVTFSLGRYQPKMFFKMHLTLARITAPGRQISSDCSSCH